MEGLCLVIFELSWLISRIFNGGYMSVMKQIADPFRRGRQWLRVTVPCESYWAILVGLMMALALGEWIIWQLYYRAVLFSLPSLDVVEQEMFRDVHAAIGSMGMVLLGFMAAAYAVMRLITTHPGASVRLKSFLKQTPWQYGQPLPWSSPRFLLQDSVVLAILTGLMYWQSRNVDELPFLAQPTIVLTAYAFVRGLGVCLLSFSAAPWCCWGMIYLFPMIVAALPLIGERLLAPGILLVLALLHLALQEIALESSLQRVSDQLFDITPKPNAAEEEPKSILNRPVEFPVTASIGHKVIGAPWNLLSPKWMHGMAVTQRDGWLTALFTGWLVVLTGETAVLMGEHHEAIPLIGFFVIVGSVTLAVLRFSLYFVNWTSPLKRLVIGPWLIPREDRALVAPLGILILNLAMIGLLLLNSRAEYMPYMWYRKLFPLWAAMSVAMALLMGPNLKEHKLTTTFSLKLNRNGNPKPQR